MTDGSRTESCDVCGEGVTWRWSAPDYDGDGSDLMTDQRGRWRLKHGDGICNIPHTPALVDPPTDGYYCARCHNNVTTAFTDHGWQTLPPYCRELEMAARR